MYKFKDNIRIRTCDELSFFIDIKNNKISMIKTNSLNFLKLQLKNGLSPESLKKMDYEFVSFVNELENQKIMEII